MKYSQLPTSYKYEVLAEAVYAREMEFFHYDFDRVNFENLLKTLPEGKHKVDIKKRLADTLEQMNYVEAIYAALLEQVDNQEAYDATVLRVTQKRTATTKDTP